MAEVVIGEHNWQQFINPVVNGEVKAMGCYPRDFTRCPVGYLPCAKPFDLPLIPESEWQTRLDAQKAAKAQLSDIRNRGMYGQPIPSRDQDGKGYCLLPGTQVRIADGGSKPVEQFAGGETVLTHLDRPQKVIGPTSRDFTGRLYEIEADYGGKELLTVTATGDHPFWTTRVGGWTAAEALRPGMVVKHARGLFGVRSVKSREVSGQRVHCLNVEHDHSFYANGFAVHNCWAHSSTSASLIARAVMNEPYVDLSAYMVACIIKGYRDEGGWGSESLEFIAESGIPDSKYWPQQSMSRSNDTPEMRANAKLHRFTEWMDLDPNNMKAQLVTCLLMGLPVVSDFSWWSHSVCTIDLVSISPFQTRIWNSWGDGWSQNGTGILEGGKAVPDSALAARVMTASAA